MTRLLYLLCLVLLFIVTTSHAASVAEQQDARVIDGLREAGSDLSKAHDIDFFFYFPDQASAEAAVADLASLGYRIIDAGRAANGSDWQVHAHRQMVPGLEAMNASTRQLEALGAKHGGTYDGWGTSVVE